MEVKRISNELYHHGIKGQRWGVRRFQNEDGSLTNAGEQRYNSSNGQYTKVTATSSDRKKYSTGKSKGVKKRGEGLGTGPVGREDRYIGRTDVASEGRMNDEYMSWAKAQNKPSQVSKYESIEFEYDNSLKDRQVGYNVTGEDPKEGGGKYSFTFKDGDTCDKWKKAVGLDEDSLSSVYEDLKKQGTVNGQTPEDRLYMHVEDVLNLQMMELQKYGTLTLKDNIDSSMPMANFEEVQGSTNQMFPALDAYDMTDEEGNIKDDWKREKEGYLSENNRKDKESGKMDEAQEDVNKKKRRKIGYLARAELSRKRAEEMRKNNRKLSTKLKRFGQSFKEVYSEKFKSLNNNSPSIRRLKHGETEMSNVKRLRDDELMHYGIKGQRRGVRRYQNEDGSLTAAGKQRYLLPHERNQALREKKEYSNAVNAASNHQALEEKKKKSKIMNTYDANVKPIQTMAENEAKHQQWKKDQNRKISNIRREWASEKEKEAYRQAMRVKASQEQSSIDNNPNYIDEWEKPNSQIGKPDSGFINGQNAKGEFETKEDRSKHYKQEAASIKQHSEERQAKAKKLVSKCKLFGTSFKEVHSENLEKSKKKVKSVLAILKS